MIMSKADRTHGQRQPPAVVVGLDCMTGLQTARILAARVPVIGIARRRGHPCTRTRVCDQILYADTSGPGLIEALTALGQRLERPAALFPCTDGSVLQISDCRSQLQEQFLFRLPEAETVRTLTDKRAFHALALQHGFHLPVTRWLNSRDEALQAIGQMPYPCVLKPAMKTPEWEVRTKAKAFKIGSPSQLLEAYDRCSAWGVALVAQQWIEGGDEDLYSCNCYFDRSGQPLVTFVAKKLRQWPPRVGTSCLGQECRNDEALQQTLRFFRIASLRGLGYLELKRDRRNGRSYLIEPNIGRPTGRSAIAEAGGVDLLHTAYCEMTGQPLPANRSQQYGGVKWVFLRRDLQSACHYWRRGELSLAEWWKSWRGRKAFALWSLSDPLPFFFDLLRAVGLAFKKMLHGRMGRRNWDHRPLRLRTE